MNRNVGTMDRAIRIVVGLALIALALAGMVGPWGYVGVIPLLTGVAGACPAYSLLRIGTCSGGGTAAPGR